MLNSHCDPAIRVKELKKESKLWAVSVMPKRRLMDAVSELIWSGSYGSTTIDHICERAGVKKGSFYYFFDSKSELAAEAIEPSWQERRAELDAIFSPMIPPLERLRKYCELAIMNFSVKSRTNMAGCWVVRSLLWVPRFAPRKTRCGRKSRRF